MAQQFLTKVFGAIYLGSRVKSPLLVDKAPSRGRTHDLTEKSRGELLGLARSVGSAFISRGLGAGGHDLGLVPEASNFQSCVFFHLENVL